VHAHTQVLGKLAATLAPPEPQLQHAALRLTARGWETSPLPAPDGSGAIVAALDLRRHEALAEHSDGRERRVSLTPDRAVGAVTRDLLHAFGELGGPVVIDPAPQEVSWTVPLDEDDEHATYDVQQVATYFAAATEAALVLAVFRAPYRGRSTPVNAWWGSFDLAVNLFSGAPADPPATDFIMRNAMARTLRLGRRAPCLQATGGGVPAALAGRAGSHPQTEHACWNADRAKASAAARESPTARASSASRRNSPSAGSQRAAGGSSRASAKAGIAGCA
jgi:hypothetical protein